MKTVAIIQARMDSTRLPNKVLMNLNGISILEQIIDFLSTSKQIDKIVVATTFLPSDDKIEKLVNTLQVDCFRGNVNDVLDRYYQCAKKFGADIIVRVTADDPIILIDLIDISIEICKKTRCDYVTNLLKKQFPLGICIETFTFDALKRINQIDNQPNSREHVTQHMLDNPSMYHIEHIQTSSHLFRPNWRLTIDYMEDLRRMEKIFSTFLKNKKIIKYDELVELLDGNNEILK
mgnify:CR=1 FL=1